ncbi:MAG: hypothetical protein JWN25_3650 [Verrucomicrobiales bacterium]|nr:hypothetical protein [Verrucomicrobiales bacterium]
MLCEMTERSSSEYNDSYPTCLETYSTLRIFSDHIQPDEIGGLLNIQPTSSFIKGEPHSKGNRLFRKANGWFYTTKKLSTSRDTRRHLDLLLELLKGKLGAVKQLQAKGCKMDIMAYYVSTGQGGPCLMPQQMLQLGKLGIGIGWDVYFRKESETEDE